MRRRLVHLKLPSTASFDVATVATIIRRALREAHGTVQFHVLIDDGEERTPVDRPAGKPLVIHIDEGGGDT